MLEYELNGKIYTEDQINRAAGGADKAAAYIQKRGLKLVNRAANKSKKVVEPVKIKENIFGEVKEFDPLNLNKFYKPARTTEDRQSGKVAPNFGIDKKLREGELETVPKERYIGPQTGFQKGVNDSFVNQALSNPQNIQKEIEKYDLDLKSPYLYYSNSKTGDDFVSRNYNEKLLKKRGIDINDFDGYINKQKLKDDFIEKEKDGAFERSFTEKLEDYMPEWMGRATRSEEDIKFKKEKILSIYLNSYLKDKDERAGKLAMLEAKKNNPKADWQDIVAAKKGSANWQNTIDDDYKANVFPIMSKLDKERLAKEKQLYSEVSKRGAVQGGIENTGLAIKNIGSGFWDTTQDLINTGLDLIGLDDAAERGRDARDIEEYKNFDTRSHSYINGKSITKNGIKYIKDENNNIYDITNGFNVGGLIDNADYKKINDEIDAKGVEDWDVNARGSAKATGQVVGAMIPQILLTEATAGLGNAALTRYAAAKNGFTSIKQYKNMLELSEAVGGTKTLAKMPLGITKDMASSVVAQTAFGYSNGYEQTLKAAKDAGINDKEAETLALNAGSKMALLYALTAPLSPQTKARELIFGSAEQNLIKKALEAYKTGGAKGFINNLTGNVKTFSRGAVGFVEEGGKETIQENIQQKLENEQVNASINELAGQKILKEDYTYQDFVNTSGLAFLSGGMIANAKLPNFKQDPRQQINNLVTLGQNPNSLSDHLDTMVANGTATAEEANQLKSDAIATVRQLRHIPKDINAETTLDLVRKLEEVSNLESSKKEIAAPFHAPIDAKIEALNAEITSVYDQRLDTEVERLQALTSQAETETFGEGAINNGQAYSIVSTKEETAQLAEEWFVNNNREEELYKTDEKGKKVKIDYQFEPAIVLPNGQIIINREIARQVDEGASAGRHELLHKILKSQFNDAAQSEKLLTQFKSVLSTKENAVIEERLIDRGYDAEYLANNKDEYLTQFFEALEAGEIKATDATFKSMWKSLIRPIYKKLGFEKLDFESGNDIYQFLKDYHITSKAGKLTGRQKTLLEAGKSMTGNAVFSKAKVAEVEQKIDKLEDQYDNDDVEYDDYVDRLGKLQEELKKAKAMPDVENAPKTEVAKKETVKKEPTDNKPKAKTNLQNLLDTRYEGNAKRFASEGLRNTPSGGITNDFSKSVIGKELGGAVETITRRLYDPIAADAKRGVTREEYKDALIQSAALLINNEFDPSKQSLDKFISSRLNLRANALASELGIEGATKGGIKKDVEDQKALIAEETAVEVKEKPKYKNALESKVFPAEVIESGNKKALSVVRTLKSRIDAPVSLNRTVTPLIGEIKDEMGKLLDIDIKTAMGGKKDKQLEKFLLKGKRYILENMTTTWLMGKDGQGGIPQAIQKQIDGKFVNFPNWVGKKIDREKTTTDQAGRTSGAELVRRLPNVANNVSDADFLAQIIGPDGNPLRGRKESLSKAMAEELAFELIKEDFENDGPILEAFNTNQERQGVEVTEVIKTEFEKQADRGNVKFSKASNKAAALFLLKEGGWRRNYLPYTQFYKDLSDSEKKSLNGFLNGTKSLIDKYEELWEKNAGVRYEKDIYVALRKANKYLTQVGLKLEEDIPDRFNSKKNDLVIIDENTDKKTVIELKSNPRDPLGSTSNGNFINNDLKYTKEFAGLQDLKDAQKSNAARTEFINYLKQLIKDGSKDIRLTPTGIQISKNLYKDLDRTGTTTNTEVNLQSLSDINSDKDILQIQNYGAFTFPGKSVGGIPPITGKIFASSEFRTNAAGKDGKWRTLTERVYFYLDPNFNQKTDFNLDTSENAVKVFDAIRNSAKLSKAKKDAITNDAVTRSLNPKFSKTSKGISVFDFDDTSAFTSGSVLYTMPDGTSGKLNAEEFAKEGGNMLDAGAEFDFSEFSKVVDGKPGPMVEKMKKMIAKFGNENFFILTARPANAAAPIKEFLDSIGIDIPIENITGLGNSAAQAKADWMTAKAAEGYNDFYFADDAPQNVEAVKKALDIPGVSSKIQQARVKFSLTSKQDLKWKQGDEDLSTKFTVGNVDYRISMIETAFMEYDDDVQKTLFDLVEENNLDEDNTIASYDGEGYNLEFWDKKQGNGITGTGNAAEVFGIVINGVTERVKKKNIEALVFTAKEPSRIKLYNSMAEVVADKLGWGAYYKDGVYILAKKPKTIGATTGVGSLKPVQDVLKVVDINSPINQSRIKFSKTISSEFNKIIEENTGMENYKVFSDIVARRRGSGKNKFDLYVPPSAADFELLLYNFIGKGERGEEQQQFFADALLKPYANGNDLMDAARQSIKKDYKELIKQFPGIKNKIESLTPDGDFTYDQAIRVALWSDEGVEIPGLSQRDQTKLVDLVNNDPELNAFKQGVLVTGRQGKGWIAPTEFWDASTIISDLHNLTEGAGRKKFLAEFIENTEEMFGKFENGKLVGPNINKIEAVYGTNVREALDDQLYRMINGKNRSYGSDKETSMWSNWVNGSTGTIMFLNTRSAALQLIGAVNFLNLRDNNPIAAAKAFANQKQYWADFSRIWNSDKMRERRGGLKEDVAAAEIANAAAGSKNKVNSVISYLLKIGYTPTQLADSFAIASGGAPFYRNRIKSYLKEGLTESEAEEAAWSDFTKVSDQTQQSGDPRDISKQQASPAGRLLLTFQNTAMQQARTVKKSFLDLKNGRGDAKTHVAKIIYYLGIQNTLFAVLQQGLFAVAFDDDDEEIDKEKEKAKKKTLNERLVDVADGVLDTILRGSGFLGGIVSILKNMTNKYLEEKDKNFKADYAKVMLEGANISPPIGSKLRKVYTGLQQTKFEKDLIAERGWGVMQDGRVHLGPLYGVTGKLVEAGTNFPMDRLVNKIENVSQAMNSQNQAWQRVAVGVGFTPYSVGIEDTKGDLEIRAKAKGIRKAEGIEKGKKSRAEAAAAKKDSINNLSYYERAKYIEDRRAKRKEARRKKKEMENY